MLLSLSALLVLIAGCTESATAENPIVLRSENPQQNTNFYEASLSTCQETNKELTADRNLKLMERNDCIDKYNTLIKNYNDEQGHKSEYRQVIDSCYDNRFNLESSGIYAFTVCPACEIKSSCDSQSMMPMFNCRSKIRIDSVQFETDITVCDVIAFNKPASIGLIHRVWKIYKDTDGVTRYKTAGDNSQQFDNYDPRFSDVLGEVAEVTSS